MDALTKLTDKRLTAKAKTAKAAKTNGEAMGEAKDETASLSRDQTMADVFVELLTGQTTADGVTAEVVVVMDDTTLFGENELPAWIPGHGPLPAGMVRHWLADPRSEERRVGKECGCGWAADAEESRIKAATSDGAL